MGGTLIGRQPELTRLAALLRRDPRGPRVAGVSGEPGIGKTRLLDAFAEHARDEGWAVAWGQAAEFEREVPFGIFADALAGRFSPGVLADRLGEDTIALLRHVFPDAGPGADLVDVERYRLHRAVRSLLIALSAEQGLVVVLDDVHWADDGSIELLDHLLRHPPGAGLVLVVAHRARQLPPRLHRALAGAGRQGTAESLVLGPLSVEEAGELIGGPAAELYEVCGGNPFYLNAFTRGGWGAGMPETDVLAGELEMLSADELTVARAAAVAGDVFEPGLVAAVAGLPDVSDVLDRLAARDLVRPGVPGRLTYRHPLLRSVVYHGADESWRLAAHGRAAAALREQGVSAVLRAHHVERSARPGDEAAIAVLIEAAVATMGTIPASTAHWVGVALGLMEEPGIEQQLMLLGLRAKALGVTGQFDQSREVLREVLRLMPAEPAEPRAQVAGFCAMIERLLGEHAEARALLQRELAGLADPDGAAAVLLKQELASGRLVGGDFTESRDWSADALRAARRVADRPLLAASIGLRVADSYIEGAIEPDTFALLDEGAELLDALADGDLARNLQAAVWIGWSEMFLERYDDAQRHLERGLSLARATGQNHLVTYLLISRGTTFSLFGRLADAAACFDDALETAVLTGSDELRTMALAQLCWIATWQGDLDRARRLGEEAVASAGAISDFFSVTAHGMLAQTHHYAGDSARCLDMLLSAGGPELEAFDPLSRVAWFELLAEAGWAVGRREDAAGWAARARVQASAFGLDLRTGFAQLAEAVARQGESPVAQARAAAVSFARSGDRVDAGRAHLLAGVLLGEQGEAEQARVELGRAKALFTECGADLFHANAIREERRINARSRRRRDADPNELTGRELEIARLVGTGMTNRQIATQLFLSPRTVEVHLSRILAKLEVQARSGIAGALSTRGK